MPWYSKELGDGVAAYAPTNQLQRAFMDMSIRLAQQGQAWPADDALFSAYDLERNMVTAYLTPGMDNLAAALGFEPCDKPALADIGMLFGTQRAWQTHFGEEIARGDRLSRFG